MVATHTEAALNKRSKQELVQLFLNTETNMGSKISAMSSEIKDLLGYFKKLEADISRSKERELKAFTMIHG